MQRRLIAPTLALVLAACGPTFAPPKNATAPATEWSTVVLAVSDAGHDVATTDESAGLIVTRWREETNVAGGVTRWRLSVVVADSGVTIKPLAQSKIGEDWKPNNRVPETAQSAADRLAASLGGP